MHFGRILGAVLLTTGLAGCFTADKPLLTDANSVAPYAKITFKSETASDLTTLTRVGKAYTSKSGGDTLTVRFMAADRANWYVVEVTDSTPSTTPSPVPKLLYGVVRVDLANKRADAFKSVAGPGDTGPGLRSCASDNSLVCIDDLKAYAASAEKYADGGAKPDVTYTITVTQ